MTITPAIALPTLYLDDYTNDLVNELEAKLATYQPINAYKASYYEQKQPLKDLGIAIPPMLRNMSAAIGWPATVVDVLEERLDLRGWASPGEDDFGLAEVFAGNQLDIEASFAHLDALIYGTAFVAVSTGLEGEPDPLITIESPTNTTAVYSPRSRHVEAALGIEQDDSGSTVAATLYLPDVTLTLGTTAGRWAIEARDDHNLGRVPITQFINRPRAGNMNGRSEITKAVINYTDAAMRTLAALEVGREFFASPQRYVLGAPERFMYEEVPDGEDGTKLVPRSAWESYLGRILAIERDENDQIPTVGEFKPGGLSPYVEAIRSYAQMLSAESAIPAHYLGFVTDNPTSADAIRQGEARLVKRVERRQKTFGRTWIDVAELVMLVRDGAVPEGFENVTPVWANAATPTRAADADRIQKLIAAGVLQPNSSVTWNELGFSPEQQKQLQREADEREVAEMMALLQPAAQAAAATPGAPELAGAGAPPPTVTPPHEGAP